MKRAIFSGSYFKTDTSACLTGCPGVEGKCCRCAPQSRWSAGTVAVYAECREGLSDKVRCQTETSPPSVVTSAHRLWAWCVHSHLLLWLM